MRKSFVLSVTFWLKCVSKAIACELQRFTLYQLLPLRSVIDGVGIEHALRIPGEV